MKQNENIKSRRLFYNKVILFLSTLSAIVGLLFLIWILITLFLKGIDSINLSFYKRFS